MEDLLRLRERVDIAIEIGESFYREFKSCHEGPPGKKTPRDLKEVGYDIAKTLVAFANADGGELFIGIEDDNTVSGVPYEGEKLEALMQSPTNYVMRETPLPLKRSSLISYDDKRVAYFSVEKGAKFVHLTSKGECFQRKDRESVPTASEIIRFSREEEISREYDRQFVDRAAVTDLDLALVQKVSQGLAMNISQEKFLQYLELAEFDGTRLRLRQAALLLFSKKPSKWHPRSQVRLLRVKGTEERTGQDINVTEIGEANGNIFQLVDEAWELLRPQLAETRLSKDARFKTQIIYPEFACREALINAITHRDYSLEGRGIEVKIFDDRLEILSPGKLMSTITIAELEELKGVHQSRNTYVARVLREYGYIRELGEGIRRIFELMESNDLVKPKLESPNKSFVVTLFHKHVYTKEEKVWLDEFEHFNLSREQKTVVRLGLNGRVISTKEIFEQVGISDTDKYRQLIESLRVLGILRSHVSKNELSDVVAKAKKRGEIIDRKAVPRYEIVIPQSTSPAPSVRAKDTEDDADYETIFVGNLPFNCTDVQLRTAFEQFGEIADISIPKNRETGRGKGYAFVEFSRAEAARKALEHPAAIIIGNRSANVRKTLK